MDELEKTQVMVEFYMVGDEFDVDIVSSLLQIKPTETRQKEDFPIKEFAKVEWSISTNYQESKAISCQFERLLAQLSSKHEIINKIKSTYNLECGFNVVIKIINDEQPEMVLTRECINFASKINAEIGFDLYYYI